MFKGNAKRQQFTSRRWPWILFAVRDIRWEQKLVSQWQHQQILLKPGTSQPAEEWRRLQGKQSELRYKWVSLWQLTRAQNVQGRESGLVPDRIWRFDWYPHSPFSWPDIHLCKSCNQNWQAPPTPSENYTNVRGETISLLFCSCNCFILNSTYADTTFKKCSYNNNGNLWQRKGAKKRH